MKQMTLNVAENEPSFCMQLIDPLNFVEIGDKEGLGNQRSLAQ